MKNERLMYHLKANNINAVDKNCKASPIYQVGAKCINKVKFSRSIQTVINASSLVRYKIDIPFNFFILFSILYQNNSYLLT